MKVELWLFTGGSREFADEIASSVHATREAAEAAEADWLADNDDDEDEDDATYFGYVEKVVLDIADANIIR